MDYIEINGFKSIKRARIEFRPINILIGANGSGKSNFLNFFELLSNLSNQKLRSYIAETGGPEKMLHKGIKTTSEIAFKTEFENGNNGYSFNIKLGNDGFLFTSEVLAYGEDEKDITKFGFEAELKYSGQYRAFYIREYLDRLRKYHFHDTGKNSAFTKWGDINNDSYFLYDDGSNLAAYLYSIEKNNPKTYKLIVRTIQSVAPYFSDFFLKNNNGGNIRLQWRSNTNDIVFGPNDLSDGTIRFIALTVLFLQPNLPDTIIIDEPELGLHPAAIAKLAGMIELAASKGCQIILATQSTDLISHFSPEDIITVDNIDGESVFNRLDSEKLSEWIDSYTVGDLWKRNIIYSGQP